MSADNFGAVMKAERKRRGMTQDTLAEMLSVTQSAISQVESGEFTASRKFQALFYECMGIHPISRSMLLDEMGAARKELGQPMLELEKAAWELAEDEKLLTESILLREALELRASRDTLAGTQAFRRKQEAAARRRKT